MITASSNCPICGKDSPHSHNMRGRWIGVDLDNTLATDAHDRSDPYTIGEPIVQMVNRVIGWIANGYEVRIFTARMCEYSYTSRQSRDVERMQVAIGDWCQKHIGKRLIATNQKDGAMEVLWDDRAVRVLRDQGTPSYLSEAATQAAEIARLTAELEKCRENAERLVPHAKWLRECGLEIAHEGHYGWANTLTMAADAIDAARSKP